MALKFGSAKNFLHLGFGILVGGVGKTIFDRFYGCSKDKIANFDSNDVEIKYGIPSRTTVLKNESYIVGYNTVNKIPDWVFQRINRSCLSGEAKRDKCSFKEDPRVAKMFSSSSRDYLKSGFSRGHMASAGKARFIQWIRITLSGGNFQLSSLNSYKNKTFPFWVDMK